MKEMQFSTILFGVLALLIPSGPARPCTSILVTRGASTDESTMITYSADSHTLYGEIPFLPARLYPAGAELPIYEHDTGKLLGKIPHAPRTYGVVSFMNEHQVAIGETTFEGREELVNPKGAIDYGSLMHLGLQRAKTARGAIEIMTDLVAKHGYASSGESFSISDPNEAWFLEMIGKGPDKVGAVWVARRIPDGMISAHANQARIRKFPLDDKKNCLYAKDVIALARDKGYYKGPDEGFSFADAYAPLTFEGLRFCEARVWNVFRRVSPATGSKYVDFIRGKPGAEPLPLWVKPDRKLGAQDVMGLMRDHFEGTELDLHNDVGAGPYALPYRFRPLTWEVDGVKYVNERSISTQQTGYSFVAVSRFWLPNPIGGLLWFGVDDTYSTVYVPIYASIKEVPKAFAAGTGTFERFSWDSAFWVFNFVANYAYSRYSDMIQDIQRSQRDLEGAFLAAQPEVEQAALKQFRFSPELGRDYLTAYSSRQTELTMTRWKALLQELLVKYLDGNVRDEKGKVTHPGYPKEWYRRIVKEKGEHLKERKLPGEPEPKPKPKNPRCSECE